MEGSSFCLPLAAETEFSVPRERHEHLPTAFSQHCRGELLCFSGEFTFSYWTVTLSDLIHSPQALNTGPLFLLLTVHLLQNDLTSELTEGKDGKKEEMKGREGVRKEGQVETGAPSALLAASMCSVLASASWRGRGIVLPLTPGPGFPP